MLFLLDRKSARKFSNELAQAEEKRQRIKRTQSVPRSNSVAVMNLANAPGSCHHQPPGNRLDTRSQSSTSTTSTSSGSADCTPRQRKFIDICTICQDAKKNGIAHLHIPENEIHQSDTEKSSGPRSPRSPITVNPQPHPHADSARKPKGNGNPSNDK